ncbi:MAG TPA: SDR family oxidoreductase [Candidatus Limnocylindrales bacterium]|nr:SDR family oxidoreductase [Candidatus Limnocylindrales bacterium]
MDVQGKVAIVTGGGTGVGRATALELARRGCSVVVNYSKSREEAEQTAAEASALGARAIAVQGDVAEDQACRRLVETAVAELGSVSILVSNAGTTEFIPHHDLERLTPEVWHRILSVNLIGPFQLARAAKAAMEGAGGGEIVHTSSIAGIVGVGSSIAYCASKAALNNLTLTLARVMGPAVRVNAVAPGFITGRWLKSGYGEAYDALEQLAAARSVLKKVCEPEDVAAAIVGIITGSDLITGQVIVVDGGMTIAQM